MDSKVELVNKIIDGDVASAEDIAHQLIRQRVDARIDDMKTDVIKTAFSEEE